MHMRICYFIDRSSKDHVSN